MRTKEKKLIYFFVIFFKVFFIRILYYLLSNGISCYDCENRNLFFLGAPIWAILFFLMMVNIGLDTVFVGVETIVAPLLDEFPSLKPHRKYVTAVCILIITIIALPISSTSSGKFDYYYYFFQCVSEFCLIDCYLLIDCYSHDSLFVINVNNYLKIT